MGPAPALIQYDGSPYNKRQLRHRRNPCEHRNTCEHGHLPAKEGGLGRTQPASLGVGICSQHSAGRKQRRRCCRAARAQLATRGQHLAASGQPALARSRAFVPRGPRRAPSPGPRRTQVTGWPPRRPRRPSSAPRLPSRLPANWIAVHGGPAQVCPRAPRAEPLQRVTRGWVCTALRPSAPRSVAALPEGRAGRVGTPAPIPPTLSPEPSLC